MTLRQTTFETPLGWFSLIESSQSALVMSIGYSNASVAEQSAFQKLSRVQQMSDSIERGTIQPESIAERILAYSHGEQIEFDDVTYELDGMTPFQQNVLRSVYQIPWGQCLTYGEVARKINAPKAARAVGGALARNPLPILIPCHRVVGHGNRLTGFTAPGGISFKQHLLELESNPVFVGSWP